MCSLEREGKGNEWDVIIPFGSPKTECLKATGPINPGALPPVELSLLLVSVCIKCGLIFLFSGLTVALVLSRCLCFN